MQQQHGESHPRALVYSMGLRPFQGENVVSELMCMADAFVQSVVVDKWVKAGDYYIYVLNIYGRSRFMLGVPTGVGTRAVRYRTYARYSSLRKFHKDVAVKLQSYAVGTKGHSELPVFPSKKWLKNDNELATKRVAQLNIYFGDLFGRFGKVLRFSELMSGAFGPTPVSIAISGCSKEVRNRFLNTLTTMLKHMQIVDDESMVPSAKSEQRLMKCIVSPLRDYTPVLSVPVAKSAWKQCVPFDYSSSDHLYRVDLQNLHGPPACWASTGLLFQFPVILVLDLTSEASYEQVKETMHSLGRVVESRRPVGAWFVVAGVGSESPDRVIGREEIAKLLSEAVAVSCSAYFEVNLTTGGNMFQMLDGLLDIRFPASCPPLLDFQT